jgi:hypothetical protein
MAHKNVVASRAEDTASLALQRASSAGGSAASAAAAAAAATAAAGAATAAAASATAAAAAATAAAAGIRQELVPFELDLNEVANGVVPGFQPPTLITLDEEFTDPSLARFTIASEGTPAVPVIAGGEITFTNNAGQNTLMSEGAPRTVPQFAVKIHVVSAASTAGNAYENTGVGFIKDSNNFLLAVWQRVGNTASIQVKIGGVSNFRGTVSIAWAPPFDLGLSLVSNTLTFWQRPSGGQWTVITSYALVEIDMRTTDLTTWLQGFSLATAATETYTASFASFESGSFGGVGIRDICQVTNEDGTVPLAGSVATVSATLVDPQGAAYCGVLTYDLVSHTLTQVGVIFVSRAGGLYNDNAAHIVKDGAGGFQFFISTWGNTGAANINILHKHEVVLNLLSGVNVVAGMAQPVLPNIPGGGGSYDPFAVLVGGTWYLAYTIGPSAPIAYYPALASSADLATFVGVGVDPSAVPYEGTRISLMDGSYWVLAASLKNTFVYDLTMTFQGVMTSFVNNPLGTKYPPHPSLIPYQANVFQVTFNNTEIASVPGTEGQPLVFRARRYGVSAG